MKLASVRTHSIEAWGGAECTVNRVGEAFRDQLAEMGQLARPEDFGLLASLNLQAVRLPVLWERVSPTLEGPPDWQWSDRALGTLRELGIRPIVGLIHHGSGPEHTSLLDPGFAQGLADHAARVAERYPDVPDWTPVNEPLTTARFSALYGIWFPHARDERLFWLALLNQIDATRLAMRAIRRVRPGARLVQTEDLGRTYATPGLRQQAAYDNQRRWMTWDLLCGRVGPQHPMWRRLRAFGFEKRLRAIHDDPCPPDVIGINHYLTSDRLLDERTGNYPPQLVGGNRRKAFADTEAVRVLDPAPDGLRRAMDEAWARYRLPIALTEIHNGCTREEQVRWLGQAWTAAREARERGVDLCAVTAWALFGSQGWNTLLTATGEYEPGAFDVSSGAPRETALAEAIRRRGGIGGGAPWWRRDIRLTHPATPRPAPISELRVAPSADQPPLLILGASGTLGQALARECRQRDISYVLTGRDELDLRDSDSVSRAIERHQPWAVANAAGWVRVDDAEDEPAACHAANATGAAAVADACAQAGIASLSFSTDLVFDGRANEPYGESDSPNPLNTYGRSKLDMEERLAAMQGRHLVVRTAAFFSPHDRHNFAMHCVEALAGGDQFAAVADCSVSPTYVPDLCRASLDLLIDRESGLWHLTNGAPVTWHAFARLLLEEAEIGESGLVQARADDMGWRAPRPAFSALSSERGTLMPSLSSAIARFARSWREQAPPLSTAA